MKILFAVPKIKSLFGDKGLTVHPHIGIAYLSSFLKKQGIEVRVFDDGIEKVTDKILSVIEEFKPEIIGVTIFSYCYGSAYNLIKKIKASSRIPLVLGGPHVGAVGKKILEGTEAEFAVKHEGEFTLLELLKEINKASPVFTQIQGLIWRNKDKIIENADRPFIKDLDNLPLPDYEIFDIQHYACYKQKTLPIITSRGCPFNCNYCSVRLSMGQNFRARSVENVVEEIVNFTNQGWKTFEINDDCFTLDKRRAEDICDLITSKNLKIRFQLYNGIRVDTVNSSLLKKMKQAGCFFISYGCEAGNDRVLKLIKKGINLTQVRDAIKWTNEVGIRNSANFIIGHTGETYEDALDTLKFAESLPTDFVNFYNLVPYPGTESFKWAAQHARFLVPSDSFLENISYRDNKPIFETQEFTKEQRSKIVSLGLDLYRKKILTFRLGKLLGNLIYWITKIKSINKLATRFALNNPVGRFIYIKLSKKSFGHKEVSVN